MRTLSQNPNYISIHFYHYISVHPSQNPNFISIHFYHYISAHCPKIQTISLYIFTIIFPHTVPKSKLYLYTFLPLYFRTLSQNPNYISIHFYHYISVHPSQNPNYISIHFYHYISVHCPKIQTISLYIFTIIFPYTVPKSKLYLYTFLPLYFRTLSQNPNYISIHFYHCISEHCPKIQTISLYIFTIVFPHTVPNPSKSGHPS